MIDNLPEVLPAWTQDGPMGWDLAVQEAAAKTLALAMSDISEQAWFASWLHGLEYDLWRLVVAGEPVSLRGAPFTPATLDATMLADLRSLARIAGGWVAWTDCGGSPCARGDECDCGGEGSCANLVSWREWAELLAARGQA